MGTVHWRKTDARYKKGFPMTVAVPTITDVVFDFCGVLLDWRTRACLEGRFDDATVDRICADDDPCGFFGYEDRMDAGGLPTAPEGRGARCAESHHFPCRGLVPPSPLGTRRTKS